MRLFAVLVQVLFLVHCSRCVFFERFLPNDISSKWFNYKVSAPLPIATLDFGGQF